MFFFCALCFSLLVGNLTNYSKEMSVTYADETPKSLHERTCSSVFNTSTPALTFFTHGLGCDASAWSNNFNGENVRPSFYSDSDSIIEKMRTSSTPAMNLYRVSSYNKNLTVYKQYEKGISSDSPHISNFSDHTLIVVEVDEWKEMRFVYEDFEYLVDSVISDYMASKSTVTIPSINLIGHSMGGLINMQYAIEHPKNVASLVSLGTPYNGSWYDNPVVGAFVSTFNEQRCISGTCNHDYYFCNLERRKNKWNEVYSQNQHIGFYALCGETSNLLWQEMVFTGELAKYQGGLAQFGGIAMDIGTAFMGWWLLPGDICVDSDSQKATGYSGAVTYTKKFFPANSNVNKRCTNNVPIPHNLETYDSDMHKCILGLIDYNNSNSGNNVEEKNNIKANIITKSNGKYLIRICNNTGFSTSIQYNSKMCFESDAKNWTNLEDIETTKVLPHGSSTIIEIEENGTATHITMSYGRNDLRKVFYANNLNETSLTMSSGGNVINNPAINSNGMEISLLSKRNDVWSILLKNKTGEEREFCYNKNMCFEDDAKNWRNIRDVFKTDPVDNDESVILKVKEFVFATDITISYRSGGTRKIAYAHNLNTDHTISCFAYEVNFSYYERNGMGIGLLGQSEGNWLVDLTNITGESHSYEFNERMCFEGDAKNWVGLQDIIQTVEVRSGETITLVIKPNNYATDICISYVQENDRNIVYAHNLSANSTMSCYSNTVSYYFYVRHGIHVGIVQKSIDTWKIRITNVNNNAINFYYNKKMCFFDDAKSWSNLTDMDQTGTLAQNDSKIVEISQYGTATSIAISYIQGNTRYIFYADNLREKGTMKDYGNAITVSAFSFSQFGINVCLIGKDNSNTWLVQLTNKTGSKQKFEYNSKMCFEGDAKNWTGLNDKMSLTLNNNETNSLIRITQNGFADYITISYVSGNTRYVFYANNLSPSGILTPHSNSIDTSNPPSQCIVEGTMITLADYSQIPVEELTGEEMLLVWNFEIGSYDNSPIMFIDSDPLGHYPVIELAFSDDTSVGVVSEHGFFDSTLCEFVYLDETAGNYIGHNFIKQDGNGFKEVSLIDVTITTKVTRTYSPVTYCTLNYYVNGMLSMPGGISGMFNIFSVDKETMSYDRQAMENDIDTYGLLTYEELSQCISVSEELFNGVEGQYLNIAIGKGLITLERIQQLAERYGSFVPEENNGELNQATYDYSYIREYITNVFLNRGLSLKQYVEHLLRSYTNIPWFHISSTDFNNSIWKVGYDETYYYAQLKIRCYGMIFIVNIAVVHSN